MDTMESGGCSRRELWFGHTAWLIFQDKSLMVLCLTISLGGLLFGVDTGVISGAIAFLRGDQILKPYQGDLSRIAWAQETIVSAALVTAGVGSALGGLLADNLGRKKALLISDGLFVIGSTLMAGASSLWMLVVGRAVVGFAIGVASVTAPVFIAESAPPTIRAALCTINVLMITFGQFLAYVSNYLCSFLPGDWRWMLGVPAVPAVIQAILLLPLEESQVWLSSRMQAIDSTRQNVRENEACMEMKYYDSKILVEGGKLNQRHVSREPCDGGSTSIDKNTASFDSSDTIGSRKDSNSNIHISGLKFHENRSKYTRSGKHFAPEKTIEENQCLLNSETSRSMVGSVENNFPAHMISKHKRKRFLRQLHVGVGLQILQQLAAINTVMYFAPTLLILAGVHNQRTALLLSLIPAAVNSLGSIIGLLTIDIYGRRKLFLTSLGAVILALIALGTVFYIGEHDSPMVIQPKDKQMLQNHELIPYRTVWCKFNHENLDNSRLQNLVTTDSGFLDKPIKILRTCTQCLRAGCAFCGSKNISRAFQDGGFCLDMRNITAATAFCDSSQSIDDFSRDVYNDSDVNQDNAIFSDGCPNHYVILVLILLLMYLLAFSPGVGKIQKHVLLYLLITLNKTK